MQYGISILLSGISLGGQYALIAIGYTMVYGILRLINFAHGDVFMVAGLMMVYLSASLPLAAAIIRLDLDKTGNPEDFTIVKANEALAELENVPLDRLLGAAFYRDIFPSGDRKWLAPYWETASRGTVQTLNDFSPEIDRFLEIKCYQPCHGFCACILTDVSEKVSL